MNWSRLYFTILTLALAHKVMAYSKLPEAVPFYRSQNSIFISGEENRSHLEKNKIGSELSSLAEVQYSGQTYRLKTTDLVRDIQLSSLVKLRAETPLFLSKTLGNSLVRKTKVLATYSVLSCDSSWIEVQDPVSKKSLFAPIAFAESEQKDEGAVYTLTELPVYSLPLSRAQTKVRIPARTRLLHMGFDSNYIRINYQGITGYIDSNQVLTRADFASWAYHKKLGWMQVHYRDQDKLIVGPEKQSKKIIDFSAFIANSRLGIVTRLSESQPSARAHVQIISLKTEKWAISKISGHGTVYWKEASISHDNFEVQKNESKTLSTDELLQREIFSIAFSSENPNQGLVSANGIYMTKNGKSWTLIEQFDRENQAVSILNHNNWFVGSYVSHDQGHSFEPYIRWDRLAEKVQDALSRPARYIKIQKIENMPRSVVQLTVDTGVEKLKLRSHWQANTWSLIK